MITVKEVLKDAKDRSNTPNPPFFDRVGKYAKTVAKVCGGVAVVGAGVITTCATAGITLPLWVIISVGIASGIGTLGAGAGVGAAKVANMTTTDKEILTRPSNVK